MKRHLAVRFGWALVCLGLLAPASLRADFAVFRAPSRILSLFALPGEVIPCDLATYAGVPAARLADFVIEADPRVTVSIGADRERFELTAPDTPGIYPVQFQEPGTSQVPATAPYRVQVVVMVPASEVEGGVLNGYPVGRYPKNAPDDGDRWRFERPRGFVEITEENRTTLISDHISLGDLDCKLDAPYPHYAAVRTGLLVKLEGLVDQLKQQGLPGEHIRVMSGFRTPDYNRSIGNRTVYSRHIAGDAADVYFDSDDDGVMDDINGDGRINRRDARLILELIDSMDESPEYGPLVGGASAYRANHEHGPFVHVDTRGYPARW